MTTIILTRKDVQIFQSLARTRFVDGPAGAELADGTHLDNSTYTAVCFIRAAVSVLIRKGLLPEGTEVPVVEPDSDPAVD